MIRIAALDDERESRERLDRLVTKIMKERGDEYQLALYGAPAELLMDLDQGSYYDLFLLDVEMPGTNGLKVAREIRKYYMEPILVYITSHMEYAIPAFEVNASRYIPKSRLEEKLPEAFQALIPQIRERDKSCYVIKHYLDMEILLLREIYYLEKNGKYVTIYHKGGKTQVRKPLRQVLKEMDSPNFMEVGKGWAVNISHVMSVKNQELNLRNGMKVPVSKLKLEEMKERMLEQWVSGR